MATRQIVFVLVALCKLVSVSSQTTYDKNIIFYGYRSSNPTVRFVANFSNVDAQCDPTGLFSFVVHGFNESSSTPWVPQVVQNLLQYRGGCVFVMDYYFYSKATYDYQYITLYNNFAGISAVLFNKVKLVGRYSKQYHFGFSYGSRLCQDVGLKITKENANVVQIDRMDLCDPAGVYFNNTIDPKPAAKNVACINTSTDKGTNVYNCHQNFRMGNCGTSQPAAGPKPMGNHGLCPYFYISAFNNNFVPYNYYNCTPTTPTFPSNVMMGYRAVFDRVANRGSVFIATGRTPPYALAPGAIP